MDHTELLELIDEIRKRVSVTYEEAKDALERNEWDVVSALTDLEKGGERSADERIFKRTVHRVHPMVDFRCRQQTLIKVPAPPLAVGAMLLGLKQPKLLFLVAVGILFSGTDVVLIYKDREFSFHRGVFNKSRKAADNIHGIRERLDDRFQDMKDQGFRKEPGTHGERYFTIKL